MFSLTDDQVETIQSTFIRLVSGIDQAAVMFYDRLLIVAPDLHPKFGDTPAAHGHRLIRMIAFTINNTHALDTLIPDLPAPGQRQILDGVSRQDFARIGAVLIWTLRESLGKEFTPKTEDAWVALYGALILANHDEECEHPTQPVRRVEVSV